MSRIKDCMIPRVNTINCDATVMDAIQRLAEDEYCEGCVIVLKECKPYGIVTESDIINKVVAQNIDCATVTVSDIMSTPLRTIDPDDDLIMASQLMAKYNVRKLVVAREGILYGIITSQCVSNHFQGYVDQNTADLIRWISPAM